MLAIADIFFSMQFLWQKSFYTMGISYPIFIDMQDLLLDNLFKYM